MVVDECGLAMRISEGRSERGGATERHDASSSTVETPPVLLVILVLTCICLPVWEYSMGGRHVCIGTASAVLTVLLNTQYHSLAHSLARRSSLWTPRSQPRCQRMVRKTYLVVSMLQYSRQDARGKLTRIPKWE